MTWQDRANQLTGTPDYIHQQLKDEGYTARREEVRHFLKREKPVNQEKAAKEKVEVYENMEPRVFKLDWVGEKWVRFGLCGDTQISSKYTQLTYLHDFYDFCEAEGLTDVYHTGDIDEGEQMRKGHQYECYRQGADDHEDEIVRVYPRRRNIKTRFICGNHDASMIKHCGHDIGKAVSKRRDDMEYLGPDCAVAELTPNCTLELRHPWDGTSYAISYKMQKMVNAMSGGEKPNILAVGHYHKQENIFYRNVHCFQTACFQAQTPFERGKGIDIALGGWMIEAMVNDDGSIRRIKSEFRPYYKAIKEDWKNWA